LGCGFSGTLRQAPAILLRKSPSLTAALPCAGWVEHMNVKP
jgi:hypothetical protein